MPSQAATRYKALAANATVILKVDRSKVGRKDMQALYGAVFVAQVAAWNAFVSATIECFFDAVADPLDSNFHAIYSLSRASAESQVGRFNTPNAENTRSLIINCTGYDPWTDWQWPHRGMGALATRQRLNEVLKVRHSLAHGFAMPAYSWNQASSGETRLTMEVINWNRAFFNHLMMTTESGLKLHITSTYGVVLNW